MQVANGPRSHDSQRHLRADAGHGEQQAEEAQFLGVAEAVQGLEVLTHDVVGEELDPLPDRDVGEHGRCRKHAIAQASDLENQRVREDGAGDSIE